MTTQTNLPGVSVPGTMGDTHSSQSPYSGGGSGKPKKVAEGKGPGASAGGSKTAKGVNK